MIWQMTYTHELPKLCSGTLNRIFKARKQLKKYSVCLLRELRIARHLPGKWTFLVKHDPVNFVVAKHVTESLIQNFTILHKVTMLMSSRELIWRGEICYANIVVSRLILKMKWRYASWEMMYFIALSFSYTSYQSRPRGRRAFRLSLRTIDERFRKMVIFVCWLTPKYTLAAKRKTAYEAKMSTFVYLTLYKRKKVRRMRKSY